MCDHLLEVLINGRTKYVCHDGKDVFWGDSKGSGYNRLENTFFSNDEIHDSLTNKAMTNFEIGQRIRNT